MKILLEPMKFEKMTVQSIVVTKIHVEWREDGHESVYPTRLLRKACPCAGCRSEREKAAANPLHVVKGEVEDHYEIDDLGPVGRYAVNFVFSDGHSSGIYSWEYLRGLCPCDKCTADIKK